MLNVKKSGSDLSEKPERTDSKGRKRVTGRALQSTQRSSSVTKQQVILYLQYIVNYRQYYWPVTIPYTACTCQAQKLFWSVVNHFDFLQHFPTPSKGVHCEKYVSLNISGEILIKFGQNHHSKQIQNVFYFLHLPCLFNEIISFDWLMVSIKLVHFILSISCLILINIVKKIISGRLELRMSLSMGRFCAYLMPLLHSDWLINKPNIGGDTCPAILLFSLDPIHFLIVDLIVSV